MKTKLTADELMALESANDYNESLIYYSNTIQNFNNAATEFVDLAMEEMNLAKQLVDVKLKKLKLHQKHLTDS